MSFFEKIYELLDPLSAFGKYGLVGVIIGGLLLFFQKLLKKSIFPMLTKRQAFHILLSMIFCCTIVCVVGIINPKEKGVSANNKGASSDSMRYESLVLKKKNVLLVDSTKKK